MSEPTHDPWPQDLKFFALFSAFWAAGLTARVLVRQVTMYSGGPLETVIGGMKFYGPLARALTLVQASIFAGFAIGIATERKWGLILALFYMVQVVMSHLIFMIAYMYDPTQGANVRVAALGGAIAVLILLYLWIRARDLLFQDGG
jgi:hypothetical protein